MALALAFLQTPALGTETDPVEQARAYFKVGARAYEAAQYSDAIQAFERAYRITPREGLLFSLAQAHRKQYYAGKNPDDLRAAIKHYRAYLERVKQGGRRADAMDALVELEPRALALEAPAPASTQVETKPVTQLMLSSAAAGVRLEIDGKAAGMLPFVGAVEPGKHRLRLRAPGYEDYTRDVSLLPGSVLPLDIPMVDRPARLLVSAPEGARVTVDGREVGTAPLSPVALAHGRHFVSVSKNGREPFARDVELRRGSSTAVEARMPETTQRTVAWLSFGGALSSFATAGVLALGATRKQDSASAILDRRARGNISPAELREYSSLREQRDDYRTASFIALATGGGLAALGTVLFVFDEGRAEPPVGAPEKPVPAPARELSASVLWHGAGPQAALGGRF